ncbi:MAG: S53 family peptidase [Acidimicrobiales bacterium]
MKRKRSARRLRSAALTLTATSTLLLAAAAGTASASPSTSSVAPGRVSVPQGISAGVIANSAPVSITASQTPVTVSFILKSPNLASLEAAVTNGWRGPYLNTQQFAQYYGQPVSFIQELTSFLSSYHIQVTNVDADNLDVTTSGTAAAYDQALGVQLKNYVVSSPTPGIGGSKQQTQTVYGSATNPLLPPALAQNVVAILGLSNYQPFVSDSIPALVHPGVAAPSSSSSSSVLQTPFLPSFFESHYNLTPLYGLGASGQNQTIGIITLASVDPTVPEDFWNNTLGLATKPNRIALMNVDGGAGPVSLNAGSDETTLDVEQSGAIAPQANIEVYQAPNTDYGFVDAFFAAASANTASSLSASWGESETAIQEAVNTFTESSGYAAAFNEAYLEAAAQGQSTFVSSGDQAAYDATGDATSTNLAVDNPGDSPYVTAAGGTTVAGTQLPYPVTNTKGSVTGSIQVTIPEEMTWNWSYLVPAYQAFGLTSEQKAVTPSNGIVTGSGGGFSSVFSEPSYQKQLVSASYSALQFLTSTRFKSVDGLRLPFGFHYNAQPQLTSGTASTLASGSIGRAMPDLAVNADPQTGYVVYDPQFQSVFGSAYAQFGGTSFSAPQLNGATVVIDSLLNGRVGFWNPSIYSFAAGSNSPFTPLDSNALYGRQYYKVTGSATVPQSAAFSNGNFYYTGTIGAKFNPGSGLGTPNLTGLAEDFCSQLRGSCPVFNGLNGGSNGVSSHGW